MYSSTNEITKNNYCMVFGIQRTSCIGKSFVYGMYNQENQGQVVGSIKCQCVLCITRGSFNTTERRYFHQDTIEALHSWLKESPIFGTLP